MSWNIKSGGFDSYSSTQAKPDREKPLREFINNQHLNFGIDTVSLADAYRWDEVYGGGEGIAQHLGYRHAIFTRLEDVRLEDNHGAGIGIAFATDKRIERSATIDLDTRQGLKVIMDVGHYGLQVANVYLDDLSEEVRLKQARALIAGLERDVPTVIVGDFNALRPNMRGSGISVKAEDVAVRALARILPRRTGIGLTIAEMNKRKVVSFISSSGFIDADNQQKRPTAPAKLPIFGIDYVFHKDVNVGDFKVLPINGESDHKPIAFRAAVR